MERGTEEEKWREGRRRRDGEREGGGERERGTEEERWREGWRRRDGGDNRAKFDTRQCILGSWNDLQKVLL